MARRKKVLIIGGAGFIGFNLLKKLVEQKETEISIADNFFRGKRDIYLNEIVNQNNIKVHQLDLTNPASFVEFDNDYDYVYMLASVVGVEYTMKIPDFIIRINTLLIINTLEWLKTTQCKKVLFTSTSECYAGTIEKFGYQVPTPENVPLCVDDISNPRFTYAVTKMLGESGFLQYSKVYGFDCTIIRYHNVYGPRMGFKHVIPQVVQRFLKNENPFKIFGHNQTRSFNYIEDAVTGTMLSMENEKTNSEIIHIGDMDSEITIEELVKYIGELMSFKGEYVYEKPHSGSVSRRCPDTTKAKELLGYKPQTDWRTGVKNTVEWYVEYLNSSKEVFE